MLPLQEPVLRKFWYPVLPIEHLLHGPCHFLLLGTPLVLWRQANGNPCAAVDRCCHRASKLSLGQITLNGHLECPYHGWQFDGAGRCCLIPQQPGQKIPDSFRIQIFPCEEKYGYLWVCLEDNPLLPIPQFFEEEDPNFRRFHGFYEEWNCAAIKYIENALDNSHQHFVHKDLLGMRTPVPEPIDELSETQTGMRFSIPIVFENNTLLGKSVTSQETHLLNQRIIEWFIPYGVSLKMIWPNGLKHHIVSFAIPKDNETMQFIRFYFRNDTALKEKRADDTIVIQFDRKLTNQDRRILEAMPFDSSLSLTDECSMAIDKPILVMRKRLSNLLESASLDV